MTNLVGVGTTVAAVNTGTTGRGGTAGHHGGHTDLTAHDGHVTTTTTGRSRGDEGAAAAPTRTIARCSVARWIDPAAAHGLCDLAVTTALATAGLMTARAVHPAVPPVVIEAEAVTAAMTPVEATAMVRATASTAPAAGTAPAAALRHVTPTQRRPRARL